MPSAPCDQLRRQGYQFVSPGSSAAVKPCLWCKRALCGGEMCYKHRFYGIDSHRCVQMTPTLRCTQRCLFCWRSFEHEPAAEEDLPPEVIVERLPDLQKRALSGYKPSYRVAPGMFEDALHPRHVAISLAGEPTCYPHLAELVGLLHERGYTTFLVSNGTRPWVLEKVHPFQTYVSLSAPDQETYQRLCRPVADTWERVVESLGILGGRRSAIRITLVRGENDLHPELYGRLIQESGARFVEVKGYMFLGYSRKRLKKENMPGHGEIQAFAEALAGGSDYEIRDESPASRVVLLERMG
ncbi:MAG: 4-demethylwyosine synthase TYW1 [Methanomicrobiales archaeon]|nr:4-demethylwyosine synthase TYW1 [Methanomicrobiales archaeon]MDD1669271.1 4-demethylwyosine synthase TYW1 [Methanomicrobiales archaeon]